MGEEWGRLRGIRMGGVVLTLLNISAPRQVVPSHPINQLEGGFFVVVKFKTLAPGGIQPPHG